MSLWSITIVAVCNVAYYGQFFAHQKTIRITANVWLHFLASLLDTGYQVWTMSCRLLLCSYKHIRCNWRLTMPCWIFLSGNDWKTYSQMPYRCDVMLFCWEYYFLLQVTWYYKVGGNLLFFKRKRAWIHGNMSHIAHMWMGRGSGIVGQSCFQAGASSQIHMNWKTGRPTD